MDLTLLIFFLVYLAMGLGSLPGFRVGRTGAAVIGGMAMLAVGSITPQQAWNAIDYSTMGMLFGLMVVSAAFVVSGFYGWLAQKAASSNISERALLAVLIIVGGVMSAFLTNDVVAVSMCPLLLSITMARGLNPVPFLLGFCFAANAGASGTIIGSPQNIIAAQKLNLSFAGVSEITVVPALLSLGVIWVVITLLYRNRWKLAKPQDTPNPQAAAPPPPPFSLGETLKAAVTAIVVVGAFVFSDWPRETVALTAAGFLLLSRRVSSKSLLQEVDGDLILLIMGLFVVNAGLAATGLPQKLVTGLAAEGIDLNSPAMLFLISSVVSDLVGNNPAVMMLVPYLHAHGDANYLGAALSLGTHFSSNLVVFGSLAGIIMVEQAKDRGVIISGAEFSKAGALVTVATMLIAGLWLLI
ncbi:SLC13 family permease [Sphingomonas sp.]|jgi:Na+/H+ antiporter NhaD/arsenite permease-like protein|uniref:SLC13 family permease n=1 Tax=Sphingomonas sp. TaxID=28214 RepID=UPI00263573C2|nr:SLC13 family permease [Sphingomonas sp.]MDF2496363.1 citrate transporter family protein [Sphingomonas sp.]